MQDKKELHAQIGVQVRKARDNACLTQEQLAEKLDCTAQFISDVERGVVGVSIPMLKSLCLTLGVSSDSILFSSEPEQGIDSIALKCRKLSEEQLRLLSEIIDRYVEAVGK